MLRMSSRIVREATWSRLHGQGGQVAGQDSLSGLIAERRGVPVDAELVDDLRLRVPGIEERPDVGPLLRHVHDTSPRASPIASRWHRGRSRSGRRRFGAGRPDRGPARRPGPSAGCHERAPASRTFPGGHGTAARPQRSSSFPRRSAGLAPGDWIRHDEPATLSAAAPLAPRTGRRSLACGGEW